MGQIESCISCAHFKTLEVWDYSNVRLVGVKHTPVAEVCTLFAHEGVVVLFRGVDPDHTCCEGWKDKVKESDHERHN